MEGQGREHVGMGSEQERRGEGRREVRGVWAQGQVVIEEGEKGQG